MRIQKHRGLLKLPNFVIRPETTDLLHEECIVVSWTGAPHTPSASVESHNNQSEISNKVFTIFMYRRPDRIFSIPPQQHNFI